MADMMSILSSSYKSAGLSVPSKTKYVAVDPKLYEGTWSGTYPDKKKFEITVSDVNGFHAQVKYQSGGTVKYQNVLIKDLSFRVGDTKMTLTKKLGYGAGQERRHRSRHRLDLSRHRRRHPELMVARLRAAVPVRLQLTPLENATKPRF